MNSEEPIENKDQKEKLNLIENENKNIVKENNYLTGLYNPSKDVEKTLNSLEPYIWQGFPFSERLLYSVFCGSRFIRDENRQDFIINEMLRNKTELDPKYNSFFNDQVITLKIIRSGTLDINSSILHPSVKISIVNLSTSRYIQKKIPDIKTLSRFEKNTVFKKNSNGTYEFSEGLLDYIPPFSTPPYDLREKGESFAEWNEEFIINEEGNNIFSSNNIMFFEISDFYFGPKKDNIPENGIIKIAWGYLKLVGYSQTYLGVHKIQLYHYKYNRPEIYSKFKDSNLIDPRIPEVLYEFNWFRKQKYQTFLEIEIRAENRPSMEKLVGYEARRYLKSVFKEEGEEITKETLKEKWDFMKKKKLDELDYQAIEKRKILLRRMRGVTEYCRIPDQLLYKFKTSKLGVLTIKFSEDGRYLAAACTELSSVTTIKLFSVEDGTLKYHFKGHSNLIHDFLFDKTSQILFSASADNLVSIWNVPKEETNNSENIDYMDNEKLFKIHSVFHPEYVYCLALFPQEDTETIIFASGCFDGNVRIFKLNLTYDKKTLKFIFEKIETGFTICVFEHFEKVDFASKFGKIKVDDEKMNLIYDNKYQQGFDVEEIKKNALYIGRTVLDHRHPNSIDFDESGRLYIGDSQGAIHIYDVAIRFNKLICTKIKVDVHKEFENNIINKLYLEPTNKRRLIVHSRDNCIRLFDVTGKPKVIINYYGLKCQKNNIKSTISPDGQFILSGSEDGRPFLWEFYSGFNIDTKKYECEFIDSLSDVAWNKHYNMFAFAGFGQEYPLLVYVNEKEEIKTDILEFVIKNEQEAMIDNIKEKVVDDDYGRTILSQAKDFTSEYAKEYKSVHDSQMGTSGFKFAPNN